MWRKSQNQTNHWVTKAFLKAARIQYMEKCELRLRIDFSKASDADMSANCALSASKNGDQWEFYRHIQTGKDKWKKELAGSADGHIPSDRESIPLIGFTCVAE